MYQILLMENLTEFLCELPIKGNETLETEDFKFIVHSFIASFNQHKAMQHNDLRPDASFLSLSVFEHLICPRWKFRMLLLPTGHIT